MRSVMRLPADGERVGRQRRNDCPDGHHRPDGTVEISVTSQTAGTSVVPPALTTAARAGT